MESKRYFEHSTRKSALDVSKQTMHSIFHSTVKQNKINVLSANTLHDVSTRFA